METIAKILRLPNSDTPAIVQQRKPGRFPKGVPVLGSTLRNKQFEADQRMEKRIAIRWQIADHLEEINRLELELAPLLEKNQKPSTASRS